MDGKIIPTGVKIISVFYYIGAVLGIIFGILLFVGAKLIGPLLSQVPVLGALGGMLFIVGGIVMLVSGILLINPFGEIVMLVSGILGFFIGRGLWKGRNWARIVVIIFSVLGIIMAIAMMIYGSIISNIPNLVIQLAIGGYLLFSHSVKEAFAKKVSS